MLDLAFSDTDAIGFGATMNAIALVEPLWFEAQVFRCGISRSTGLGINKKTLRG